MRVPASAAYRSDTIPAIVKNDSRNRSVGVCELACNSVALAQEGFQTGNGCHCAGGRGCERTSAISCCSDFRASLRLAGPMDSIIAYTHTLTGRGRRFCAAVPSHVWFAGLECRNTPMPLAAYRVATEQRSPFPAALGVRFLIVTPSSAHPC